MKVWREKDVVLVCTLVLKAYNAAHGLPVCNIRVEFSAVVQVALGISHSLLRYSAISEFHRFLSTFARQGILSKMLLLKREPSLEVTHDKAYPITQKR
jgi:hypothetical protein